MKFLPMVPIVPPPPSRGLKPLPELQEVSQCCLQSDVKVSFKSATFTPNPSRPYGKLYSIPSFLLATTDDTAVFVRNRYSTETASKLRLTCARKCGRTRRSAGFFMFTLINSQQANAIRRGIVIDVDLRACRSVRIPCTLRADSEYCSSGVTKL